MPVIIVLAEIYWVGLIISGTVRHGLRTEAIFWIAALIEVAIGFLIYTNFKRHLIGRGDTGWNFLSLGLTVVAIAIPITLSYTADSLEIIRGTWVIFTLTVNSCYLYRIIRKEPMSRQDGEKVSPDEEMSKSLRQAKIFQIALMSAVLIYIVILIITRGGDYTPIFSSDDPELTYVIATLGAMGVIITALAGLMPKWMIKLYKQILENKQGLLPVQHPIQLSIHILRSALFESIAVYGLILGILGASWAITLPFFIVATMALILTFPTEERWKKLVE